MQYGVFGRYAQISRTVSVGLRYADGTQTVYTKIKQPHDNAGADKSRTGKTPLQLPATDAHLQKIYPLYDNSVRQQGEIAIRKGTSVDDRYVDKRDNERTQFRVAELFPQPFQKTFQRDSVKVPQQVGNAVIALTEYFAAQKKRDGYPAFRQKLL